MKLAVSVFKCTHLALPTPQAMWRLGPLYWTGGRQLHVRGNVCGFFYFDSPTGHWEVKQRTIDCHLLCSGAKKRELILAEWISGLPALNIWTHCGFKSGYCPITFICCRADLLHCESHELPSHLHTSWRRRTPGGAVQSRDVIITLGPSRRVLTLVMSSDQIWPVFKVLFISEIWVSSLPNCPKMSWMHACTLHGTHTYIHPYIHVLRR